MTTGELTPRQWQTVQAGRQALIEAIGKDYPAAADQNRLGAVAIAGAFADMCTFSLARADLVAVINAQLRDAGLELRPVRRQ